MKTIGIRVTGKVQGVFYRQSTRDMARKLGLKGMVRNEANGDVYILASGDEDSLEKLVTWCRQGPPRSIVTGVTTEDIATQEFPDFSIDR